MGCSDTPKSTRNCVFAEAQKTVRNTRNLSSSSGVATQRCNGRGGRTPRGTLKGELGSLLAHTNRPSGPAGHRPCTDMVRGAYQNTSYRGSNFRSQSSHCRWRYFFGFFYSMPGDKIWRFLSRALVSTSVVLKTAESWPIINHIFVLLYA